MTETNKREEVLRLYGLLVQVQSEEKRLQKEKDRLKEQLGKLIPSGERVAGVKRTRVSSQRVSWKEVVDAARVALIPRTKWHDLEVIQQANTKVSEYDVFSSEEV